LEVVNKPIANEIPRFFETPILYNFILNCYKHLFVSGELYIIPTRDINNKVNGFDFVDPRSVVKYINPITHNIQKFKQVIP
jgi:hypothetical protein